MFFVHLAVYLIAMAILWGYYAMQNNAMHGGAYPWEAWFTGSWFIAVLGHLSNTFFDSNRDNSDKGYMKYLYEKEN